MVKNFLAINNSGIKTMLAWLLSQKSVKIDVNKKKCTTINGYENIWQAHIHEYERDLRVIQFVMHNKNCHTGSAKSII